MKPPTRAEVAKLCKALAEQLVPRIFVGTGAARQKRRRLIARARKLK